MLTGMNRFFITIFGLLIFEQQTTSFSISRVALRQQVSKNCDLVTSLNRYDKIGSRRAHLEAAKGENTVSGKDETVASANDVVGPLSLLLVSQLLLFIGVGAVIPSIPLYGKELGFSSAANGIVISVPSVALLLLSKVGGNYADKARKPAMIFGMALIAVSDLGTALAGSLPMLLVARLGLGAGRCISESGERGMLADLANQINEFRGRALAAQQACVALGIAIGAPLGGIIVERYGPRAAFLCVTVAAFTAMTIYCFLPETLEDTESAQVKVKEFIDQTTSNESEMSPDNVADWGALLAKNQWKGIALCQSGASFGFAAKIAAIPVLAASNLPGGAAAAGALISAAGLSGLIGAPAGGILTDRAGARTAVVCSGFLSAIGLILIPVSLGGAFDSMHLSLHLGDIVLDTSALAFSGSVVTWSLGASAQAPALVALAQQNAPKGGEATALALPKAFGDGTYIGVPFLLGLVTDAYTEVPGIECAVAGMASMMGIIALAILVADESQEA